MDFMTISILVYLADISHNLKEDIKFITIMIVFYYLVKVVIAYLYSEEEESKRKEYPSNWYLIVAMIVGLLSNFIPQERTFYIIAGTKITSDVVSSEYADKVKKIIDAKLNELVDEATKTPVVETIKNQVKQ